MPFKFYRLRRHYNEGSAKATAASAISKIDPAVYVGESETTASVGLYIHLIFIFTLDSPSIVRRRFIRAETRWL